MAVGKSTAIPAKLKQSLETGRTTTEREMNIYAQARPRILVVVHSSATTAEAIASRHREVFQLAKSFNDLVFVSRSLRLLISSSFSSSKFLKLPKIMIKGTAKTTATVTATAMTTIMNADNDDAKSQLLIKKSDISLT